jgi:hypothetical protein
VRVQRSRHRRLGLALLAALALTAAAPAHAGAKTLVRIGGTVGPAIIPFTTTPQPLALTVDVHLSTDVPDTEPATITRATVWFPHGPRVNGALFPSCDPRALERAHGLRRACPAGSRIGGGVAIGEAPQLPGVTERLRVDVYNGPGGRSVVFWLHGDVPVSISGMIVAPLRAIHSHRWAYRLTLPVPHALQEVGPDIFASLLRFTTRVGATERVRVGGRTVRRGYIEALACPPGALVPIHARFDFRGRTHATADGYVGCR